MAVRAAVWSVVASSVLAVAFAGWMATHVARGVPPGESPFHLLLLGTVLVSWAATGAVLVRLRPGNPLGWLFLGLGASGSWQTGLAAYGAGAVLGGHHWPAASAVAAAAGGAHYPILFCLPTVVLALYPEGRLSARWLRRPVTAAAAAIAVLTLAAPFDAQAYDDVVPGGTPPLPLPPATLALVNGVCLLVIVVCALVITGHTLVRLVRSRPPQRQQLAWMTSVLAALLTALFLAPRLIHTLLGVLLPVAVAVGVVRYRMLGVEIALRRTLVYGTLTAVVAGVYLLASAGVGAVWPSGVLPGVLAAAVVAIGLNPARERLQRAVDWWIYGGRRDPLRALIQLGDQMADVGEHALLPAALEAVKSAVRAPAAGVTDPEGKALVVPAAPPGPSHRVELRLAGRALGMLTVAERTPGEPYGRDDKRLLAALAQQLAVIVRALELGEAVAAERDRVVEATRAERDRLRTDLHDGLGPSLAGIGLGLQAAVDGLAADDTATVTTLLERIREEVVGAVAEIRRIIDGLRPLALDRFGLAEAARRHALSLAPALDVDVRIDPLPPLPPAVESAAYRILTEALTNAARHARARHVVVALTTADRHLRITVADDGIGTPAEHPVGIGVASMRRRAHALGGGFTLTGTDSGTTVTATLPLEEP
ncbi:sensor histidine kinase [Streptomyces sp. NPDC058751]|uniref:sensor histidine kinase n=1 Tax=Streptomyces sp. NPDC058751 TaxID=3346623 RepID=UPI0036C980E5